jgi:hypothetical protein
LDPLLLLAAGDVLTAAKAMISDPAMWIPDTNLLDSFGREEPIDENTVFVSITANRALFCAIVDGPMDVSAEVSLLAVRLYYAAAPSHEYLSQPRTHGEVIDHFARAIEYAIGWAAHPALAQAAFYPQGAQT